MCFLIRTVSQVSDVAHVPLVLSFVFLRFPIFDIVGFSIFRIFSLHLFKQPHTTG